MKEVLVNNTPSSYKVVPSRASGTKFIRMVEASHLAVETPNPVVEALETTGKNTLKATASHKYIKTIAH